MHHIISDGWSVDVLMRELAGFYCPLQGKQAQADEHQKQLSYWVEQLQTSRPAELLCDKAPTGSTVWTGWRTVYRDRRPAICKLQSFCQLHGVTQFVVLLAASALHTPSHRQDDATIGTLHPRFDLEFHLFRQSDSVGNMMFSTDLYAPETIDNLLSVFQRLREDNYAKLDAMGLVRAEETAYPRDSSVVDLFRDKPPLAHRGRSLAPETLVGVFASRSCEAIVAFLGILKANLAYLPFDVKIPRKRMEDNPLFASRPPNHLEKPWTSRPRTKAGKHTLAVCSGPSATSLAYVMFTSGSTGMPKGVMAEHRGIIYSTLLRGGTLVCIGAGHGAGCRGLCCKCSHSSLGLDMLCVGGEAVHPADLVAAKQYLTGKFVNGYGPTENTTFSATFLISPEGQYANGIPIGRALSNSGAFVMDAKLQLVRSASSASSLSPRRPGTRIH
ncbi:hypothetical protein CFE70_010665 [Pyrenophora teres f. teres 0-1]